MKIDLTREVYEQLLAMAGFATGAAMRDGQRELAYHYLELVNSINEGNPEWTRYPVPAPTERARTLTLEQAETVAAGLACLVRDFVRQYPGHGNTRAYLLRRFHEQLRAAFGEMSEGNFAESDGKEK